MVAKQVVIQGIYRETALKAPKTRNKSLPSSSRNSVFSALRNFGTVFTLKILFRLYAIWWKYIYMELRDSPASFTCQPGLSLHPHSPALFIELSASNWYLPQFILSNLLINHLQFTNHVLDGQYFCMKKVISTNRF